MLEIGVQMISRKKRPAVIWYSLLCLLLLCASPTVSADASARQPTSATDHPGQVMIRLGRSHFDPMENDRVSTLRSAGQIQNETEGMNYYIVQFDGPVLPEWKQALVQNGVEILDYVPDFAFSVRMNSSQAAAVEALAHVRWVGPFKAQYRLSNGALEQLHENGGNVHGDRVSLRVILFAGADAGSSQAAIQAIGGSVEAINTDGRRVTFQITLPAAAIGDLSTIEDIKWIEKAPQWRLHNSTSTDIIDARTPRDTHGLYGQNQVVAVSDTGLDTGLIDSLHRDFGDGAGGSRVDQIIDLSGDGASDEHSSHGTHVAGSVLGNGLESGSNPSADDFPDTSHAGLAPKARLIFQALESNSGNLSGIPNDLNELFEQARLAGAHLHTNSWGQPTASIYTAGSQDVDQYMWDHKDYLIVFSAGSNGVDMDGDGVVDQFRIESPATAKNCLTVGASEGYQPSGAGLDLNWGDNTTMWQYWFTADPIASDHVSDNYDGMAATSARGPTLDGRTKPDLVAPGSNILSTRSSQTAAANAGWGLFDEHYMWNGGTSTSAPLTAGAAAVMRQYLIESEGITVPSAALIKAALINSAEDISPGQYAGEIPQAPSSVAGWGRLNLGNAIHPAAPSNILYYDEADGLGTGESDEYVIQVIDASQPLKINLVWTDYPGTPASQGRLVNDLDLQVTDPSLAVHYPDQAAQQSTITTIRYDSDSYANRSSTYSRALRFTPTGDDTYLDSVTFALYNAGGNGGIDGNVDVVVYPDNGSGRPDTTPANEIFRKTLTFAPWTMISIPVNINVGSDDFHIAIEDTDTTNLGLYIDTTPPCPDGRSSYWNGSTWLESSVTPYIRANMRSANSSDTFDRVNNVVGITIDAPVVGEYTVRVNGFNIPEGGGSQPYALIANGNIVDTRAGTIQFASATFDVSESGGSATITATRTGGSDGAVSVSFATSAGTASADSDYTTASGTLAWVDGDSSDKTFTVSIIGDSSVEQDETVQLALSNIIGNAVLGAQTSANLTIYDDDNGQQPGILQFSAPAYSVDESGGSATITATRTGGSDGAVSVSFATNGGTASSGSDYTAASGTLNWADGDSADKTITIAISDDSSAEEDETVNLALTNPSRGSSVGGQNATVLTIVDNDTGGGGGGGGGGCFIQSLQ
jgi:hypothetical protein